MLGEFGFSDRCNQEDLMPVALALLESIIPLLAEEGITESTDVSSGANKINCAESSSLAKPLTTLRVEGEMNSP
ncbi:hypothetical protein AYI70_g7261 [Smittium culicis]|uniref:Uncharacterized protein n=1 Tax=Smittium culicis TaxID=133412 RepID=A0A1R1XLE5_9FUNG|nr:hypothetical protein AYI70_g7261 [Smittium culicis]